MFTNNLVMFSFRFLIKILVGDQLQQRCFGASHLVIQEPEYQDHIQHSLESNSVDHGLDRVNLKTEFVKKTWYIVNVLNGGHSGYIGRENLSGIGIYRGHIRDIFKNRMSKSDCKYTYLLVLNRISIRQYMHKLYKST